MNNPKIKKKRECKSVTNKEVVLVAPTYNQYEATRELILRLQKQTMVPDIIIVDNQSEDDTYKKLTKEFPKITAIQSNCNAGSSGGQYLGQKYAYDNGWKYIILNDNDAYPFDDNLIEKLVKNSTSKTVPTKLNVKNLKKRYLEIYTLHYGCFHRDIITQVGFVNPNLFLYGDDVDYYYRLRMQGINFKYVDVRYEHKNKYYFGIKHTAFLTRNTLYHIEKYPIAKGKVLQLAARLTFFRLYDLSRYKEALYGISCYKENKWGNLLKSTYPSEDIEFLQLNYSEFRSSFQSAVRNNNLLISKNLRTKLNEYQLLSFLKINTFITTTITTNIFLFKKVYYITDFDKKSLTYFSLENNLWKKIRAICLLMFYYLIIKIIIKRHKH